MESRPDVRTKRPTVAIGILLVVFGALSLLGNLFGDMLSAVAWIGALAAGGVIFAVLYATNRDEWWPLIPSYVLFAVAGLIALITTGILRDTLIPAYVLFSIALPFLVVASRGRDNWWALIPAYVMSAIAVMLLLIGWRILNDLLIPAYVMFAIAVPFLFVFLRNPRNWWALIPGGIMAIIGAGFLIGEIGVTILLPAALIIGGLVLLGSQFFGKHDEEAVLVETSEPVPVSGPEADRPR